MPEVFKDAMPQDLEAAWSHIAQLEARLEARAGLETRLLACEERFRATFELAGVALAHIAPDGTILRINHHLCTMLGYARQELVGHSLQELTVHCDDDHFKEFLSGKFSTLCFDSRFLTRSGRPLWTNLSIVRVRGQEEAEDYFVLTVKDISAQKQLDATIAKTRLELERRNLEVAALCDTIRSAVLIFDDEGRMVRLNSEALRVLGLREAAKDVRSEDLVGRFAMETLDGAPIPADSWPDA